MTPQYYMIIFLITILFITFLYLFFNRKRLNVKYRQQFFTPKTSLQVDHNDVDFKNLLKYVEMLPYEKKLIILKELIGPDLSVFSSVSDNNEVSIMAAKVPGLDKE